LAHENTENAVTTSRQQILSGIIWGQIGRIADIGLTFLFSIFIIRLLSKAEYGGYSTILNLAGFIGVLTGFGLSESLNRFMPELQRATSLHMLRFFLLLRLVATAVLGGFFVIFSPWIISWLGEISINYTGIAVLLLGIGLSINELLVAFYTSSHQLKYPTLVRFVFQLITISSTLIGFWLLGVSLEVTIFVLALATLGQTIAMLGRLYLVERKKLPQASAIFRGQVRTYAGQVWLVNIITFFLTGQFLSLVIAFLLQNPEEVAYYALVMLIMTRVQTLVSGWLSSALTVFSTIKAQQGLPGLRRYFALYYKLNVLSNFPIMAGIFATANALIPYIFTTKYNSSVPLFWVITLDVIISIGFASGLGYYFLLVTERQSQIIFWRVIFATITFGLVMLLIPPLGAMGALLAGCISNTALHIIELWLVRDIAKELPLVFLAKMLIITCCSILLVAPISFIISDALLALFVSGGLFVIIFSGQMLLIKPFTADDVELANRVRPKIGSVLRYFAHTAKNK
jgi:O-antigen/teichoic acid export membrane protein